VLWLAIGRDRASSASLRAPQGRVTKLAMTPRSSPRDSQSETLCSQSSFTGSFALTDLLVTSQGDPQSITV
jgi:hypothetical protein